MLKWYKKLLLTDLENMHSKDRIDNNGYDYVDLGLPSGTLWAKMNVGANKPTDYGLYFQWGDTIGYTADQVGTGDRQKKYASDRSDCKWYSGGAFIKYIHPGESLHLEDDGANVNMGGDWHIPTPTQIKELIVNTTSVWTTLDDVNGILFTSKKDITKSIFIPASGSALNGLIQDIGSEGNVWSSMLDEDCTNGSQHLYFYEEDTYIGYCSRIYGLPIRGVIG